MAKRSPCQAKADRNYEDKRKGQPKVSSFFVSDDDIRALDELTEYFGESRKGVFLKALHGLHEVTFSTKKTG